MVKRMKRMGRKRVVRKYKGKRKSTVNVNRALQPIPQRYICKMKYADTFDLNTTGVIPIGTYRYNLNSIFDPNQTGTGHQPYGHDTFQTLYNRYRVIKVSWNVYGASSNPYAVNVACLPANEVVAATNVSEVREKPRARWITQGTGAPQKSLKGSIHLPSLMGRNKAQYMADDRYQAVFGSSPSELAILNIYGGLIGDAAVSNTISCNIELIFTVECFDIKDLAQS